MRSPDIAVKSAVFCLIAVILALTPVLASAGEMIHLRILGVGPCVFLNSLVLGTINLDHVFDPPVDMVWIFTDCDAVLDDPLRPVMVLDLAGHSGPWDYEMAFLNPYGEVMPAVGIKYILQPGGDPLDYSEEALLICPTQQDSIPHIAIRYWRDLSGEIGEYVGSVRDVDLDIPGCETLPPEDIYYYIWEHGATPVERSSWARVKALYAP